MKKNPIIIIISTFVVFSIVALVTFVFSVNPIDNMKTVDLIGTWKIAAYFSNGTPMLPESEFIIFTEDFASTHRDGATITTSQYTLISGTNLELSEISKKYSVEYHTDNYIRLYENANVYIELIRYPREDLSEASVEISKLYDKWNVVYRNTETPVVDEVLVFSKNTIEDYRDGATKPIAISEYSWTTENCLLADKWGIEFELIQLSDDVIFFIEIQSGLIWELCRAS